MAIMLFTHGILNRELTGASTPPQAHSSLFLAPSFQHRHRALHQLLCWPKNGDNHYRCDTSDEVETYGRGAFQMTGRLQDDLC